VCSRGPLVHDVLYNGRDVYGPQRPLVENRFVYEGVIEPPLIQMAFS
jgi:hypothetical protein